MAMCLTIQVLFVVVLLQRMLLIATATVSCSCYTFHTDMKTWDQSYKFCATNNGSLVVMETEVEWKFINSQIQNKTVGNGEGDNEWYIGLTGRTNGEWKKEKNLKNRLKARNEGWKWVNGKDMTIDKWQRNEPNTNQISLDKACVKMAKDYPKDTQGLFDDLACNTHPKPYICEYGKPSSSIKIFNPACSDGCRSLFTTMVPPVTTTTPSTTPSTRQSSPVVTYATKFTDSSTFTTEFSEGVSAKSSKPEFTQQQPVSDVFIALIVLAVVLALFICIFGIVFWRMKKKAEKSVSLNESKRNQGVESNTHEKTPLNIENDLTERPLRGVQIVGPDTVIYAEVTDDIKPPPVPVYNDDVSDYAEPVDSLKNNLYESMEESQPKGYYSNGEVNAAGPPVNKENNGHSNTVCANDFQKSHAEPQSGIMATYPVVNLQNTNSKPDNLYDSVDDDVPKIKPVFNGYPDTISSEGNAENIPGEVTKTVEEPQDMAVYAVVDKSKKTKKVDDENNLEDMYAQVDKSKKAKNTSLYDNV